MNSIQATIDQILADRRSRLQSIEKEKRFWDELATDFGKLFPSVQDAVRLNRDSLGGIDSKVQEAAMHANEVAKTFQRISERFGRNDICIGIGGAGRMGKSTFLQSVTGLGEDQIPTSDMYYTTAGRSLIVNATKPIAIADMHTEASFLKNVIAPMCDTLEIPSPGSLAEFQRMEFPEGQTQAAIDIINRLEDTRRALPTIREELTGEKGRRIQLADLRDYVAYPDGGQSKAGKFMAVENIVIYAPFPQAEVKQLRVVDLPGLGEAGRDLAKIQTSGMSDICDITLLMKRPDDKNVSWNLTDTNALDAMKESSPLVKDQTMYTAILANVNGEKQQERADACVDSIRTQLSKNGRDFRIIRCNARDRKSVLSETMPEVLSFLAKNLPEIDRAILSQAENAAEKTRSENKKTLQEVKEALSNVTRATNGNLITFRNSLFNKILDALTEYEDNLNEIAEKPDEEWNNEVRRVTELVKEWISNGCGYGSKDNLISTIEKEIKASKDAQPTQVINQIRINFRKQWEVSDRYLQTRIGNVLEGFIKAFQSCTNSFVPPCEEGRDRVDALRKQLNAIADKLMNTPDQEPGEDVLLDGLAAPLRRLSEFDLRFRFHLEPTLIAATDVLVSNKLPTVKNYHDANLFTEKMMTLLTDKAEEYSKGILADSATDKAFNKKVRLVEGAVKDPAVREELITMLQDSVATRQSFRPNRIFAAVIENAVDSILRFDGRRDAFEVMVRGYEGELREKPTPEVQAAINAYAELDSILKRIR